MTSPYLDEPLTPLAMALLRMLEKIETQLADQTICAAKTRRLRQRAGFLCSLLGAGDQAGDETARMRC